MRPLVVRATYRSICQGIREPARERRSDAAALRRGRRAVCPSRKASRATSVNTAIAFGPESRWARSMAYLVQVFLMLTIMAGLIAAVGISGAFVGILQTLFFVFLALLLISFMAALWRRS